MDKFSIEKTKFDEVLVITPRVYEDDRGYFCETYNVENLKNLDFTEEMLQDSQSASKKNVIRGLHYQWEGPMGKLVRAVRGSVRDVVVDIRKGSPTYGEHMSIVLSCENHKQLWVPAGFAHGILSLEDNTTVTYKCSSVYNSNGEGAINPFDSSLDIDWGILKEEAILSPKDMTAQTFGEYDMEPKFEF